MKKLLLFTLAIGITVSVSAQKTMSNYTGTSTKVSTTQKMDPPYSESKIVKSVKKRTNVSTARTNAVTDIALGTSANALGFYSNGRTYLWADNNLNSVIFTHRGAATPGSGFIMMDISLDGGTTWAANFGPVYTPDATNFAARYPQGAIYNPAGNTNPANAYAAYIAPTLDGSNSNWGGLCYGVQSLDTVSVPTQASFTSDSQYKLVIPDAFHMSQTGTAWSVDMNYDYATSVYLDSLILYKGVFNTGTHQFDYTRSLFPFAATTVAGSPKIADFKVAFAPDGQIGYISMLGHDSYTFMPDSAYYPILFKTTNGGTTWTGPIRVDISSIPGIQAMWPDSNYTYTTAFEHDLAVDGNGNPYLTFDISPSTGTWSIATAPGYLASAVVYSTDGGTSWDGSILEMLQTFRGTFGTTPITSDSRNQISTTMNGSKMFMTWLDTDTLSWGSADGNYYPDIHMRAIDVATKQMTPAYNITQGTEADAAAFMGSPSYYVFGTTGTYELPLVYQAMDPANDVSPVVYHYIKGFTITDADFVAGINEANENIVSVSQNYPNPFSNTTNIVVNLTSSSDLSLSIINLIGQNVVEINKGTVSAGTHTLTIDGSNLKSGIYFYTVKAGASSVTHKMIVE